MRCAWSKRCDEVPTEWRQMLLYCPGHATECDRNRVELISVYTARHEALKRNIGLISAPLPRRIETIDVLDTYKPPVREPEKELFG